MTAPTRRRRVVHGWPPRHLTKVPPADRRRGDGDLYGDLIEATCRITKDSIAGSSGELMVLRHWQRQLLAHLLARRPDGRYRHRTGLVGIGRKNGKSGLGAGIGIGSLLLGGDGGEVYSCAGDKQQAKVVFDTARDMVDSDPELRRILKTYRDVIDCPGTGSTYRALSSEAFTKEGLNPTLCIFDEVHVQPTRELWDVMQQAMGSRREPLMLGITTAGVRTDRSGQPSLCASMYDYGCRVAAGEINDPTFFFAWWEPESPNAPHDDPRTWRQANPGYGDLVSDEDFASVVLRTPEPEFRAKRCNQWIESVTQWRVVPRWEGLLDPRPVPDRRKVVLTLDGSFNGDSTVVGVVEVSTTPHVDLVHVQERQASDPAGWEVDIVAVEDAIRQACRRWDVVEVACDPYRWSRSMQVLADEGLPIVEFPQSPARMTPATELFEQLVLAEDLTHSGHPVLSRHVGHAHLKTDSRGSRVAKENQKSRRHIDGAIAAIMGVDRAYWHATNAPGDFFY